MKGHLAVLQHSKSERVKKLPFIFLSAFHLHPSGHHLVAGLDLQLDVLAPRHPHLVPAGRHPRPGETMFIFWPPDSAQTIRRGGRGGGAV